MNVTAAQTLGQDNLIGAVLGAVLERERIRAGTALTTAPAAQEAARQNVPRANQVGAVPGQSQADSAAAVKPAFDWKPVAIVGGLFLAGLVVWRLVK